MNIKSLFKYEPQKEYNFTIEPTQVPPENSEKKEESDKTIYTSIEQNLEYIKTQYNTIINSDIIIREFILIAKNKEYKAFLLYIDGMSDSDLINNYVLKPLMMRNKNNTFDGTINQEEEPNKITAKKVKKIDLTDYIYDSLIPQNSVNKQTDFNEIFSGVNSGDCALFVDTINMAFDIDVKGFKQRSVDKPSVENVIKGPQEAFVENIRTNTSLLRRFVNNQNLIIENISIGKISQTNCALCYMHNITNSDLVGEARYRLSNLSIDSLLSAGQLEQLIQDDNISGIPQILSTERPDKCVKALMQGRVVILINGNPYALIIPAVITDFLSSPEDTNLKPLFANFLKCIRFLAFIITLLLPGTYVAITSFHQELLPTELLFSIFASRENVPFPIIFEILVMEISFELIREGGLRSPSAIGSTLGIVGALILGDAAVSANIVSQFLIIVVAITGLASFAIPDFSFGFHLRVYRFIFTLLGYTAGFLGIGIGIFVYISVICSLKSFGVSYTSPIDSEASNFGNKYFIPPFWKQEYRDSFLATKKKISQSKISMKWKNQ